MCVPWSITRMLEIWYQQLGGMTAPAHHSGGKNIYCCSENQWATEAYENTEAHEVQVRWQRGVEAQIIIQWEETKVKARKPCHVSDNLLGSCIESSQPFEIVSIILKSRRWLSKSWTNPPRDNTPQEVEPTSTLRFSSSESVTFC